jgi:hypothetical protein
VKSQSPTTIVASLASDLPACIRSHASELGGGRRPRALGTRGRSRRGAMPPGSSTSLPAFGPAPASRGALPRANANHHPAVTGNRQMGALTCGFGSGPKGIRTPDLLAASQALYQLSYGPGEAESNGPRKPRPVLPTRAGERRATVVRGRSRRAPQVRKHGPPRRCSRGATSPPHPPPRAAPGGRRAAP